MNEKQTLIKAWGKNDDGSPWVLLRLVETKNAGRWFEIEVNGNYDRDGFVTLAGYVEKANRLIALLAEEIK